MARNFESFLGANTPQGFVSFFDELYNPYENCRAYIIKGGPGTGKSTLMKKVLSECENRGISAEKVYCSSDPDSLDGIIVPDLGISIADGTSPHTLEPKFPGACENIINTGAFWDKNKLRDKADEIRTLTLENSIHHRRSVKYLSAIGSLAEENIRIGARYTDIDKIENFALRFAMRELPRKKNSRPGTRKKRFISALTPKGEVFLDSGIKALASRVIAIDDEYTAVSSVLLDRIGEIAVKNGYDVIFCYCPLKPRMTCEHIIIPEMKLALVTARTPHKTALEFDRVIHCKRFLYEGISNHMSYLRFNRRLMRELTDEAVSALREAKATHDKLENIYVDAMDFNSLNTYLDNLLQDIWGNIK